MPSRVRAFLACSLDGFIAGPHDELDWLPGPDAGVEDTFSPFMAEVGAMLMGRRTFDVVRGFGGPWPYGETPVFVATSRPIDGAPASVRRVEGATADLVAAARLAAGERDVYLDGGVMFRAALADGLVDELTLTLVPVVLGAGKRLFAPCAPVRATLVSSRPIGGGLVQLRYAFGDAPA